MILVITDNDPDMHIRGHCEYSHQLKKTFEHLQTIVTSNETEKLSLFDSAATKAVNNSMFIPFSTLRDI